MRAFSMQHASTIQATHRYLPLNFTREVPHCVVRCSAAKLPLPFRRGHRDLRVIAMLRKRSAQDALLLSPENSSLYTRSSYDSSISVEDDSYVELRLTASCGGVLGRVKIFEDASFSFSPHEVAHLNRKLLIAPSRHHSARFVDGRILLDLSMQSLLLIGSDLYAGLHVPMLLQRAGYRPAGTQLVWL